MIDNRIKFRHLQCFIEVVRQGGVVKAASHLSITQPSVSKKIRELEEMLNVALLDRQKRGVVLTRHGEIFLRHALNSTSALHEGILSVERANNEVHPPVSIGALPTVAARIMPAAIARFKVRMPNTKVNIITGPTPVLLDRLRVSELDVIIGRLAEPDQMQGLLFEQLYLERITIAVRPGHSALVNGLDPFRLLADYPVILPAGDSIIHNSVERFLIAHGITLNKNQVETNSHAFGRAYVMDTDAAWLISRGAVMRDFDEGALIEVPVDTRDILGPVGFSRRVGADISEALAFLSECVRSVSCTVTDDQIGGI
ncbi:MAG: pca operon transcription factor PcaQ [Natronospirillum sp.]